MPTNWLAVFMTVLRALWVRRRWRVAIASHLRVWNDFSRVGWFAEDREDNSATETAGSEALTLTRRRRGWSIFGWPLLGSDVSVLPDGLRSIADAVIRFWDKIGLPVSTDIRWGRATEREPRGYRLLLGAYNRVYDLAGRFRRWREILEVTRSRTAFLQWCRANGLGHLVPGGGEFGRGERPTLDEIRAYFRRNSVWWVKLDEEVLGKHPIYRCTTEAEMVKAIAAMGDSAFIIQENVKGKSYSLSYEVVRTWYGRWKPVLVYVAEEMVVGSSQLGAHAHPDFEFLRRFADPIARRLVRKGIRHMIGFGVIYDFETCVGYVNDNNLRQQGGHPVWQYLIKAITMAGMLLRGMSIWQLVKAIVLNRPLPLLEFYYEYLDLDADKLYEHVRSLDLNPADLGEVPGEVLLAVLAMDDELRPNLDSGAGLHPVGITPSGSGKFTGVGADARRTVDRAKEKYGLHLRHVE